MRKYGANFFFNGNSIKPLFSTSCMHGYLFPLLATTSSKTQPSHALATSKSFYISPEISYLFSVSAMHNMHIGPKQSCNFKK